jgi:hypothetical protein
MGMRPGLRPLRGSICSTQNGGNLETRYAQTSKFLIPIFPCFEPAALIGAHTHSTRSAAKIGISTRRCSGASGMPFMSLISYQLPNLCTQFGGEKYSVNLDLISDLR